ncbi:arginase [Azospirillum canadense]|uniref:arginase n=1 Tax=Azospirillum canadense TaxID=403962 RepID=UPI0022272DF9|nr:arginase [Azospirillum canadense]MCW2244029.1 arginase [Azospirillum canadense]
MTSQATAQDNSAQDRGQRFVEILGVPIEAGAGHPGALMGPAALRTAGLVRALRDLGHEVRDLGDMTPAAGGEPADRLAEITAWSRALADRSYDMMRAGGVPVFLGGDHSLSMGSVTGVARHCRETGVPLFVLWLDAHGDFNTPTTSPSGNMHGMPVALLCGEDGFDGVFPPEQRATVDPAHVHLFGIRSLDPGERRLLRARGVDVVDMRLIDEHGVGVHMRRIIERVKEAGGHLHVSLDVDFLDPSIAPAVGTAVLGGATYREAHLIMEMLHDAGVVGSLDVVELNPFLDERGKSALLLVDLVASLFGRRIIDPAVTQSQIGGQAV